MNIENCIKELAKKQLELRCEKMIQAVQTFNRDEYDRQLKDNYLSFLLKEKNHFSRFLEIVSASKSSSDSSIPVAAEQSNSIKDLKMVTKDTNFIHIKSLTYFIEKLMENDGQKIEVNLENQDFLNSLAFSLFPAISTYFHISIAPGIDQRSSFQDDDILKFQLHNYNNVFMYLSQKIKSNPGNDKVVIYEKAFDLLMSPLFASPLFINFCINFFQPIFSELQNKECRDELKNLSISNYLYTEFNNSFNIYTHLIPSFIVLNLKESNNLMRTVEKSFFEIALKSPESAQYYGLFHYSKPPSPSLLASLRQIFNDSHDEDAFFYFTTCLDSVGDIVLKQMESWRDKELAGESNILTCSCSDTMATQKNNDINAKGSRISLALAMKNYYFEEESFVKQNKFLLRVLLLSKKDIELLQYILNEDPSKAYVPSKSTRKDFFQFINFGFSEDGADDFVEVAPTVSVDDDSLYTTMADNPFSISPNLRHLLQNSDPIPNFKTIPESLTLENFIEKYLVQRGPLSTLPKRRMNSKAIYSVLSLTKNENEKISKILKILPNTSFNDDEQIKSLTIATSIRKKIDKIMGLCLYIKANTETIDNLVLLSTKNNNYFSNFKSSSNQDYFKNPAQFQTDLSNNSQKLDKSIFSQPKVIVMKMIDQSKVTSGSFLFSSIKVVYRPIFLDFRTSNKRYQKVDDEFNNILIRYNNQIIEKHLSNHFPIENVKESKMATNKFIHEKVLHMNVNRNEIILICKESFNEESILRKLELFNRVYTETIAYVSENLPNNVDAVGADEMIPLVVSVIFLANPKYVTATCAFLTTFFSKFKDQQLNAQSLVMRNYTSTSFVDMVDIMNSNEEIARGNQEFINTLSQMIMEFM